MTEWNHQAQTPAPRTNLWGIIGGGLIGVILLLAALGGGFLWGRQYQRANPDAVALSASNESIVAGQPIGAASSQDLESQFKVFWQAWDLIGEKFYHTEPLDQQKLIYGAIRGMLQSLGDDFTSFHEPEDAERTREDLRGNFEGIGAYVEYKDNKVLIVSPIEGSPAEKADLRAGDVIIAVDGTLMADVTKGLDRQQALQDAIELIRGPKGSTVKLTIFREETDKQFDVEIVRDEIPLISVRSEMIDDIAYVHISEFKATTYDELDAALVKLKAQNPKAFILDLRNNPGGYVTQAQNVLGRFVENGVTYYQEDSDGNQKAFDVMRQGTGETLFDLPMVTLVNGGSASASEIVSGALQDYKRSTLLGEKTFGKGSVQSVNRLSDNSELRVTIAHWLTPEKRAIHGIGITPDDVVPFSDDAAEYPVQCLFNTKPAEGAEACGDSQLFWALKVLRGEGPPPPPATPTPTPGK